MGFSYQKVCRKHGQMSLRHRTQTRCDDVTFQLFSSRRPRLSRYDKLLWAAGYLTDPRLQHTGTHANARSHHSNLTFGEEFSCSRSAYRSAPATYRAHAFSRFHRSNRRFAEEK